MSPRHPIVRALCVAVIFSLAVGCAATRQRRSEKDSGFLRNYDQIKPNPNYPVAEIYMNENADWSSYDSVQIDSVGLWVEPGTKQKLKDEERQMLTDLMYKALHDNLGKFIVVTDQAGPDTLRLRAALTQAKGANVPLRTVTTYVPQLRMLSTVTGLSADVAATVGSATIEVEVLDSITNQRLAAAVDSRAGSKALFTGRTFEKWGDIEYAADLWSKRITWQLVRHGVRRKPGAGEPEKPEEKKEL